MHPQTIYTKTSKGVLEIRNKAVKLSRELNRVFLLVDGKSTLADMLAHERGLEEPQLVDWLTKLETDGYIRVFSSPAQATAAPAAAPAAAPPAPAATTAPARPPPPPLPPEDEELDFTSPEVAARLNAEAAARARAEAEARARADAAAR